MSFSSGEIHIFFHKQNPTCCDSDFQKIKLDINIWLCQCKKCGSRMVVLGADRRFKLHQIPQLVENFDKKYQKKMQKDNFVL